MLGVEPVDRPDLLCWSDDMMGGLGSPDPARLSRAMTAFSEYTGYIAERIARRRRDGDESGLVGVFANAPSPGSQAKS
ncbi:hypothetical protein [Amycolatopsis sp. lyj-109]|uniref:hypothetical protein n=1 Tax=Amycolatopsis sp. lyj-109 TaxID=2789287 RepID=UPI003979029B